MNDYMAFSKGLPQQEVHSTKTNASLVGHIIGRQGVLSDPEKTRAIVNMEEPKKPERTKKVHGNGESVGEVQPKFGRVLATPTLAIN